MSDLYLVLRRRLNSVAGEWLEVPTDVLREARKRKGLSYESAARAVPVAAKTWERWEKKGRLPIFHVDRIGAILDLEIERPAFSERITVPRREDGSLDPTRLEEILERVEELHEKVDRLSERLPERRRAPSRAKKASKPARSAK